MRFESVIVADGCLGRARTPAVAVREWETVFRRGGSLLVATGRIIAPGSGPARSNAWDKINEAAVTVRSLADHHFDHHCVVSRNINGRARTRGRRLRVRACRVQGPPVRQ
jgi:hypothetical protein